ncbi:hypothetical protein K402DRAFT_420709 [Aulographum hederae CBS 113979]|uniref:Ubiquitin 3 binding protein But2 C-terminal domain-containing protein n=1 Tax=Aulographum hederae CBS 113979 TaxID=1176131 RepID=A0A6G1H246_9PEZI|nr:hypothetical protein K402DRAFT_420709 [Aulographum hederae CBS 113979]
MTPLLATIAALASFFSLVSSGPVASPGIAPTHVNKVPRHGCPGYLYEPFIFPTGIYPVSQCEPDKCFGPSYSPMVSPGDMCTIFNLEIPEKYAHSICTLKFFFPEQWQLDTSSFSFEGMGNFDFHGYTGYNAQPGVTWNSRPPNGPPEYDPPPANVVPGGVYTLHSGSCLVKKGMGALKVGGVLCSSDTNVTWFQDYNPCPIGIFIQIE